ncbi:MAG: sigma-70 family RNA polymerase sigma factor [Planctomycetota bacterium]
MTDPTPRPGGPSADALPAEGPPDAVLHRSANWSSLLDECREGLIAVLSGRLANRDDVEDCLQNTYVKAIEQGDQVPPAAQRAWLFRVAINEANLIHRKAAVARRALTQESDNQTSEDPSLPLIKAEQAKLLERRVKRLPESWQQVIQLRINEDLTFQQIADRLDIPLGTALSRMNRALKQLRNSIPPNQSR